MIVFYTAWVIVAAAFILTLVIKRTRQSSPQRPTSDTVIELACDADKPSHEREAFAPETLQYLYEEYGSDHQPRTEADRHVAQLYKMLESKSLDIEGRLFLWREIWDIKIAALADATD